MEAWPRSCLTYLGCVPRESKRVAHVCLRSCQRMSGNCKRVPDVVEVMTCSPKTDPLTMRVQQPKMGIRRTLYGQTTLTGADRAQAPPGGGKASRWSLDPGGGQGTRHKRSYLPSLEKPIRCDEHLGGQAPQGALKKENARLKKLLAEKELDIDILKEVSRGNF